MSNQKFQEDMARELAASICAGSWDISQLDVSEFLERVCYPEEVSQYDSTNDILEIVLSNADPRLSLPEDFVAELYLKSIDHNSSKEIRAAAQHFLTVENHRFSIFMHNDLFSSSRKTKNISDFFREIFPEMSEGEFRRIFESGKGLEQSNYIAMERQRVGNSLMRHYQNAIKNAEASMAQLVKPWPERFESSLKDYPLDARKEIQTLLFESFRENSGSGWWKQIIRQANQEKVLDLKKKIDHNNKRLEEVGSDVLYFGYVASYLDEVVHNECYQFINRLIDNQTFFLSVNEASAVRSMLRAGEKNLIGNDIG